MRKLNSLRAATAILCVWFMISSAPIWAQHGASDGEWRSYGGDSGSTKYSALDQINSQNVKNLQIAWRWVSPEQEVAKKDSRYRAFAFKPTPLMAGGVLYTSTSVSQVAAIDAATGKTIWVYDPKSYEAGRPANTGFQHRGVAYWSDGKDARILIATGDRHLIAVNAKTGETYPDFGENGKVDLSQGLGREIDAHQYTINSPPVVCRDTVVVGAVVFDFPMRQEAPPGHVRGFDVRTGKQKWIFHTIPQEGEPGTETWENESWKVSGAANVWSMMSADPELGYVYLPTSTPTNDWYGGHRLGNNLYAESLVCVDGETGKQIWHYQFVHHGLWDYDLPAAPILLDINANGKKIKAVTQVTKNAFTFVFDRVTGEPVWPIEERAVPPSNVPGERTSPTQPFPTKPPAFDRQGVTENDLCDFTPELHAEAVKIANQYDHGPMFTPPSERGTIIVPSSGGGANWPGAAADPETGILYVPSITDITLAALAKPDPNRSDFNYIKRGGWTVAGPQGLPLLKPPYARITAIDLNKGEHVWMVPHGEGPVNHPLLKDLHLGPLGSAGAGPIGGGGPLLTKTLLFVGQGAGYAPSEKGGKPKIRAFDKKTGAVEWEFELPANPSGTPMTYAVKGKQYIVVATGGGRDVAELVALALP